MRVCLISLGCPKNLVDGETILGQLAMAGHEIAAQPELAEAVIVNTCAFIQSAQHESMQVIRDVAQLRRTGALRLLAVSGCLAQRQGKWVMEQVPEVDGILGTGAVGDAALALQRMDQGERVDLTGGRAGFLPEGVPVRLASTPPWRAYLKVTEGCSNRCAYCLIPDLRGPARSREPGAVVEEARQLAGQGVRELTLVGQDLTRYGADLDQGGGSGGGDGGSGGGRSGAAGLPGLIDRLATQVPELHWIRLHYLHPARVDRELLVAMARAPNVCRYLDMPVQHADRRVLAAMNRGTPPERLLEIVAAARATLPGVSVRTSLIVGFPGETESSYRSLLRFMRQVRPDYAGIFTYSRQQGTPAAEMPNQVAALVKVGRRARALALQRHISRTQNEAWIGKTLEVLVEGGPKRIALPDGTRVRAVSGRSHREAPDVDGQVHVICGEQPGSRRDMTPGSFVHGRVVAAGTYDLYCKVI